MIEYPDEAPINIGDRVEVLREPTREERKEWSYFRSWMESSIGKTGTITEIIRSNYYYVRFPDYEAWSYPAYLLRVIR